MISQPLHAARTSLGALLVACGLVGCAGGGTGEAVGLPQWSVTEELRIGGAGDPSQTLTAVADLVVDDAGRIYVAQPQEATIKVFGPDGRRVGSIGEGGREPGQFDRIYGLGLLGDTVYAIDFGLRRVSYFSTSGELYRTQQLSPPPANPPFLPGMPFAVFPDGSMAVGTAFSAGVTPEDLRRVPQLRIDPVGEVADTVTWVAYERTGRRADSNGRMLSVGSPFSDDAFAIFSRDGSRLVTLDRAVASGSGPQTFGVTVADGWGDTIYSRRYGYEPVEVEQAVIDEVVANGARRIEGAFPTPQEALSFVRSTMFLPVHYPPVTTASFSQSDSPDLWLRREAVPEQQQRWMVLDEEGEPLAEALLPATVQVWIVRDDAIWGVESGEPNVPYVVRYGIGR